MLVTTTLQSTFQMSMDKINACTKITLLL